MGFNLFKAVKKIGKQAVQGIDDGLSKVGKVTGKIAGAVNDAAKFGNQIIREGEKIPILGSAITAAKMSPIGQLVSTGFNTVRSGANLLNDTVRGADKFVDMAQKTDFSNPNSIVRTVGYGAKLGQNVFQNAQNLRDDTRNRVYNMPALKSGIKPMFAHH